MTNQLIDTPPERPPATATAAPGPAVLALRRAAVVGGAALVAMAALAGFGGLVVVEGLVTEGDAAATARDVMASEGLFRLGVLSLYAVVVLDVVVAWALRTFLSPVSREGATLAAWFRLAYAGVFLVAIAQLAGVPRILAGDGSSAALDQDERQAEALVQVGAYHDLWMAGLVLFGLHLALVGVLVARSGYVPRLLGLLLVVAGAGYVLDTVVAVLLEDPPFAVSTVTFLGEFLLAVWLLVRGRRVEVEVSEDEV